MNWDWFFFLSVLALYFIWIAQYHTINSSTNNVDNVCIQDNFFTNILKHYVNSIFSYVHLFYKKSQTVAWNSKNYININELLILKRSVWLCLFLDHIYLLQKKALPKSKEENIHNCNLNFLSFCIWSEYYIWCAKNFS